MLSTNNNNYNITDRTLSLYHVNVTSLTKRHDVLTKRLDLFSRPIDIIALTDNYLIDKTSSTAFSRPNYTALHKKDISVYYHHSLNVTILPRATPQVASTIVQIHDTPQKTNPIHTVICLYRRPRPEIDKTKTKEFIMQKHKRS